MPAPPDLLTTIRRSIVGEDYALDGPFGPRRVTYVDYTASGRSLSFIEDFLREHVMPLYANTHTESSGTGLQTSTFREDARRIIHRAVGGGEDDVVIFAGSGATGAVQKLIEILNLRIPRDLDERYALRARIPEEERPVVFIGPFEHHSNELPWRESIAEVVVIDEDENGRPDTRLLEEALQRFAHRPLRIGSFSAASNVTGIGAPTREISSLLHRHGALAFWDFAAAAPYVRLDMNLTDVDPLDYKDAIFLSPHKFIGGPGTPGVLVIKRHLLTNRVPSVPGGGTVRYVNPVEHRYLEPSAHREEGGTPAILESIRAGLVFQLKEAVGHETIRGREDDFIRRAIARWGAHPNLRVLGNVKAWRLSIVSFMVRHGERYLHHNFVVALLNDLFGIQARGGCSCAGPYGHRLLGIDVVRSREYEREILRGSEGIKPGWIRVNFNYFLDEPTFEFLLDAVEFVATHGAAFLPLYRFSPDTGLWRHRDFSRGEPMRLDAVTYGPEGLSAPFTHGRAGPEAFDGYLRAAEAALRTVSSPTFLASLPPAEPPHAEFEKLRWFPLPHEITRPRDP